MAILIMMLIYEVRCTFKMKSRKADRDVGVHQKKKVQKHRMNTTFLFNYDTNNGQDMGSFPSLSY
jgi:hypothetical protein